MRAQHGVRRSPRLVNPRLGTYFSIFAALFTALFLLILIFEQLRLDEQPLKLAFFAGPILIFAAIGISVGAMRRSTTSRPGDVFRRRTQVSCSQLARLAERLSSPAPAPSSLSVSTRLF